MFTFVEIEIASGDVNKHIARMESLGIELVSRRKSNGSEFLSYRIPPGVGFGLQ
jgi:hypothetical protein